MSDLLGLVAFFIKSPKTKVLKTEKSRVSPTFFLYKIELCAELFSPCHLLGLLNPADLGFSDNRQAWLVSITFIIHATALNDTPK